MPGIKLLREESDTYQSKVLLQWMGMNIWLVKTLEFDGKRYFYARVVDATLAEPSTALHTAKWTILKEAEDRSDATACTTSNGSAPNVTEPNM